MPQHPKDTLIKVDLEVSIREDKEAGVFVSYCPALDLYSQAETHHEALDAIYDAVSLWLEAQATRRRVGTVSVIP